MSREIKTKKKYKKYNVTEHDDYVKVLIPMRKLMYIFNLALS